PAEPWHFDKAVQLQLFRPILSQLPGSFGNVLPDLVPIRRLFLQSADHTLRWSSPFCCFDHQSTIDSGMCMDPCSQDPIRKSAAGNPCLYPGQDAVQMALI